MESLQIVLLFLAVAAYAKLVYLRAIRIGLPPVSAFELQRQLAAPGQKAKTLQKEQRLTPYVQILRRVVQTIATIALVLLLLAAVGWVGVVVAFGALLVEGRIAQIKSLQKMCQRWYERVKPLIFDIAEKGQPILRLFKDSSDEAKAKDMQPASLDELMHVIKHSKDILSSHEKSLLTHAMQFDDKRIGEVMTPRAEIRSVDKKEVIGPVTLTDLHTTGHSRFPVIDGDLDHIIGILYAHEFMNTQRQGKMTAQKVMEPRVFYLHEAQTLEAALAAFLRTKHYLFIVVNEFEETTGVITIEDILWQLFGRKLAGEFDQYEDRGAVAQLVAAKHSRSAVNKHD